MDVRVIYVPRPPSGWLMFVSTSRFGLYDFWPLGKPEAWSFVSCGRFGGVLWVKVHGDNEIGLGVGEFLDWKFWVYMMQRWDNTWSPLLPCYPQLVFGDFSWVQGLG